MRLLLIFLLASLHSLAQIGTGQWRLHIPAYKALDVVVANDHIFTAYINGVSDYNPSSGELSTWDFVTGLSDISITCLGYSIADNSVFIGYDNGNIDKLKGNAVTNIPAVALAQVQGSKRIHRMVEKDGYMYLATGFAIVKIDPTKNEVRDTYYPTNGNAAILDLAFRNDTLFALAEDRLYFGISTSAALADPAEWTEDPRVPITTGNRMYQDIENASGIVYLSRVESQNGYDSVFVLNATGISNALTESFTMEIRSMQTLEGRLVVNYQGVGKIYNGDLSQHDLLYTYGEFYPFPNALTRYDGKYFIADDQLGLVELIGATGTRIAISGPPKNAFYSMDWSRGKLAIAGGGLSGIFHTYSTSGFYTFHDETWETYDYNTLPPWLGQSVYDFLAVSVNPTNVDEIAVGSFSNVPVTIVDGGNTELFTPNNSLLGEHSNGSGETFVSDLQYDKSGNLWVLNGMSDYPIKVYTKDGEWYTLNTGPSTTNRFSGKLVIDNNGNKWFGLQGVGVVGLDDGGSIETPGDDEYVVLNSGENSGALPSIEITALAADLDNEIWIGTDNGFAVLYNSTGAFSATAGNYNAQRIKLEFEGNVEYVLGATHITDIVVDGANRKWFGTANAGIILLSADGLEILEQHTVENSPLISNNIIALELDQNTGELFIITDQGLVSYRTNATEGKDDYESVTVFPNPKRPEYDGPITIQGIKYDSDVRITDAGGRLVYQTTSNGGTATWDGRTINGEKVSTGVYLIWTAPNNSDVKGRKVGKVLVVN